MNIPGAAASHQVIRDGCRTGRGEREAFEESVRRLRAEYDRLCAGWPVGKGVQFHLVLSVERPEEVNP